MWETLGSHVPGKPDGSSAGSRVTSSAPAPQPPKHFEVGVFCGKYVTPVDEGYFEHLERIRGEARLAKVVESAKEAVVAGRAGESQLRLAQAGVWSTPSRGKFDRQCLATIMRAQTALDTRGR